MKFDLEKYKKYMQTAYMYGNVNFVFTKLHYLIRFEISVNDKYIEESDSVGLILLNYDKFQADKFTTTFSTNEELSVYSYLEKYTIDFMTAVTNNDYINKLKMLQKI